MTKIGVAEMAAALSQEKSVWGGKSYRTAVAGVDAVPASTGPEKSVADLATERPSRPSPGSLPAIFTRPLKRTRRKARRTPNSAPEPVPSGDEGLLARLSQLEAVVGELRSQLARRSAQSLPAREFQAAQQELQNQQRALQRSQQDLDLKLVQLKQAMIGQQEELTGGFHHQVKGMQQQIHHLEASSRKQNLIIHTLVGRSRDGLLGQCNAVLKSAGSHLPQIPLAALRPMKTRNPEKQMWHLQLDSGEAKHVLFGGSQAFRRTDTYLDDDLTKQQLLGRRSLGSKRLQLKQLHCITWWRRDTLCWSDANGVHKQVPAGP